MPDEFKALMRALDADVRELARKYRRSRIERVLLWLVVAGMITLGVLYYLQQLGRHDDTAQQIRYTNRQIRELACVIIAPNPDTIPVVKAKRAEYHCPPYDPAVARKYRPTATRTLTPSPAPTVTRTASVPQPARTVVVPGPVRTVTRTVVICRMPNGRNCR